MTNGSGTFCGLRLRAQLDAAHWDLGLALSAHIQCFSSLDFPSSGGTAGTFWGSPFTRLSGFDSTLFVSAIRLGSKPNSFGRQRQGRSGAPFEERGDWIPKRSPVDATNYPIDAS